jgi:hypothetical protein
MQYWQNERPAKRAAETGTAEEARYTSACLGVWMIAASLCLGVAADETIRSFLFACHCLKGH